MPYRWDTLIDKLASENETPREKNVRRYNIAKNKRRNTRHPGYSPGELLNKAADAAYTPMAYMTPGVGDYMAHQDAVQKYGQAKTSWDEGKYLNAAAYAAGGLADDLTTVPVVGDIAMAVKGASMPLSALMTAYHGTPHKFPPTSKNPLGEFDISKVGTGEGAQAYGHGLYLAENKGVGKEYQTRLSYMHTSGRAGREISDKFYELYPDGVAQVGNRFYKNPQEMLDSYHYGNFGRGSIPDELADVFDKANEGHLYEVDLPDSQIEKMLDWDAPLSEQPESVRKALGSVDESQRYIDIEDRLNVLMKNGGLDSPEWASLVDEAGGLRRKLGYNPIYNGSELVKDLEKKLGSQQAASEYLNSLGIPGIKYYDGGSRAAAKGTRNFVIFDPEIAKIIGRNGEKALPMDEASRMGRARESGYNADVYHASQQDIKAFKPGYDDGLTFVTPNPEFADKWAGLGKYRGRIGEEDAATALDKEQSVLRSKMFDYDKLEGLEGDEFNKAYDAMRAEYRKATPVRSNDLGKTIYPLKAKLKKTFDPVTEYKEMEDFLLTMPEMREAVGNGYHKQGNWIIYENKKVVNELKRRGYDSMKIAENIGGPHDTIAVFDPKNIRSKFAKFDPKKADSTDILAGAAGLGLTGMVAKEYYNQKKEQKY